MQRFCPRGVFPKGFWLPAALGLVCIWLTGCRSLHYYQQAISGQYHILAARKPIEQLMGDDTQDRGLKARLALVLRLRRFASRQLALPVGDNYRSYVDLQRPYVVWNVFATREFSLAPLTWCYPLVGCLAYQGYFDQADAESAARPLREQGCDVYIGGVSAYSTLGWFDDPVLSTFIHRSEADLAGLLFHELAHQCLYVKGDTVFNESFASAVEAEGVRRWLIAGKKEGAYSRYAQKQRQYEAFVGLVLAYKQKLETLYAEDLPDEAKRAAKQRILGELKGAYSSLEAGWGQKTGYGYWFESDLNNAKLATIAVYHELKPAFLALLGQQENDLANFYNRCRQLAKLPKARRHEMLRRYLH